MIEQIIVTIFATFFVLGLAYITYLLLRGLKNVAGKKLKKPFSFIVKWFKKHREVNSKTNLEINWRYTSPKKAKFELSVKYNKTKTQPKKGKK